MESFNQAAFLYLNAAAHPGALALAVAQLLAQSMIWLVPAGLLLGWLSGGNETRKLMLQALIAAVLALLCAQLIGAVWPHPRPFMVGLGNRFLAHAPDASFPSDHLTLWWSVSFSLLTRRRFRLLGATMSLLGLSMAWARVYLGVHFPLDMVGAAAVALFSCMASMQLCRRYIHPLFAGVSMLHRAIFGPLIRRGWLRH